MMRRTHGILAMTILGSLALLTASVRADTVRVTLLDGRTVDGELAGMTAGELTLAPGTNPQTIPLADITKILFTESRPVSHEETPCTVYLTDDGKLHGRLIDGGEGWIEVNGIAERVRLPFEGMIAIQFNKSAPTPAAKKLLVEALADPQRVSDLLIAAPEDDEEARSISGVVKSIDPQEAVFVFGGRERRIRTSRILALVFAQVGATGKAPPALAMLSTDDALPGALESASAETIKWRGAFGASFELPLSMIHLITYRSDRVFYLSDLDPSSESSTGIVHDGWKMRRDRNAFNEPILLGGHEYAKGLGAHAESTLDYPLAGKYETFAAVIGIDDAARPAGDAVFVIQADEQEVYRSPSLTGRDAPVDVRVPVKGVQRLTLIVEMGHGADVGDCADWADARLIKPRQSD